MKKAIYGCLLLLAITGTSFSVCAAAEAGESPQALYLRAGKLERQGEMKQAVEQYETLIARYPESEFAVKANDRLLELMKAVRPTVAGTPATPAATSEQPLPADPLRRRALELARLYRKAVNLRDDELSRLEAAFQLKYGHRFSRAELAQRKLDWDKAADAKVRQELGMGADEIKQKLGDACHELGVDKNCDENSLK